MDRLVLIFALTLCLFTACDKDETALNDYDLYHRLQSNGGTWRVESITTKNHNDRNSIENPIETNVDFMHFYLRTELIFGTIVDIHTVSEYDKNGVLIRYRDAEPELERIVFGNKAVFGGEVWTVKTNKRNKQVWTFSQGNQTTTLTLDRCNCKIPITESNESGG